MFCIISTILINPGKLATDAARLPQTPDYLEFSPDNNDRRLIIGQEDYRNCTLLPSKPNCRNSGYT